MRDMQIPIRVSEQEYAKIKANAGKENVTVSEYMRNLGINGNGQKDNPKLLCHMALLLQEAENKFKDKDDKEILRKAGKRLWEL
ncbi:MAG: hypothetical protein NC489_46335 [Ruminococcus flavefaciens]|nr:hypothetical protein [Ruminococcus flavefaciens]